MLTNIAIEAWLQFFICLMEPEPRLLPLTNVCLHGRLRGKAVYYKTTLCQRLRSAMHFPIQPFRKHFPWHLSLQHAPALPWPHFPSQHLRCHLGAAHRPFRRLRIGSTFRHFPIPAEVARALSRYFCGPASGANPSEVGQAMTALEPPEAIAVEAASLAVHEAEAIPTTSGSPSPRAIMKAIDLRTGPPCLAIERSISGRQGVQTNSIAHLYGSIRHAPIVARTRKLRRLGGIKTSQRRPPRLRRRRTMRYEDLCLRPKPFGMSSIPWHMPLSDSPPESQWSDFFHSSMWPRYLSPWPAEHARQQPTLARPSTFGTGSLATRFHLPDGRTP